MNYSDENLTKTIPKSKPVYDNYWLDPFLAAFDNPEYNSKIDCSLGNSPYRTIQNKLEIFNNLIIIHDQTGLQHLLTPPIRKQYDISSFSRNSRLRLMRITSRVLLRDYTDILHATFTFHNNFPTETVKIKELFRGFWKRLHYNYPDCHFIWRMQFQKRGAPHWHIIFLLKKGRFPKNPEEFRQPLSDLWLRTISETSIAASLYAVKCTRIDEVKKFFLYISKYCAKVDEDIESTYNARRWGYSRDLSQTEIWNYKPTEDLMKIFKRNLHTWLSDRHRMSKNFESVFFSGDCIHVFITSDEFQTIYLESILELKQYNPSNACEPVIP